MHPVALPTLTLREVEGAIAFYLNHRDEADKVIQENKRAEEEWIAAHPTPPEIKAKYDRLRREMALRRKWPMLRFLADADFQLHHVETMPKSKSMTRPQLASSGSPEAPPRRQFTGLDEIFGVWIQSYWRNSTQQAGIDELQGD
jgi:hypothetical protein